MDRQGVGPTVVFLDRHGYFLDQRGDEAASVPSRVNVF